MTQPNMEAVGNNIIFQFVDEVTSTRFKNTSASGLIISSEDGNQTASPRWAEVLAIGPNVKEVRNGDFILIEPGKWTFGFTLGDDRVADRFWKTDEDRVIAISDAPGNTY
jgi:co-chaperonin GroES (HSP10)